MLKEAIKRLFSKKVQPEETENVFGTLIYGGMIDAPVKIKNKFATKMYFTVIKTGALYHIGITYRVLGLLAHNYVIVCNDFDTQVKAWFNEALNPDTLDSYITTNFDNQWRPINGRPPIKFILTYGEYSEEYLITTPNDARVDCISYADETPAEVKKAVKKVVKKKVATVKKVAATKKVVKKKTTTEKKEKTTKPVKKTTTKKQTTTKKTTKPKQKSAKAN